MNKPRVSFKTPKGTELPLLNLRGKEYLQVQHRIVWFREEHPRWGIQTEIVETSQNHAIARATIRDDADRIIATAIKSETKTGFADFLEKSETGAIGRALALCGYGTAFAAADLDEGDRIVDSPLPPKHHENIETISKEEAKSLAALAVEMGWTEIERQNLLVDFGLDSILDLPVDQVKKFEAHLRGEK